MKISIIIPFFNTKKQYLERLFQEISCSNIDNLEFIFVDDGSEENISSYVENFCKSKEFIYFKFANNHGVSFARNKGIELATNNFLMFVDSDDIIDFNFINNTSWNEDNDLILFKDTIFFENVKVKHNEKPVSFELPSKDLPNLYFRNKDGLNLRSACCKILSKKLIISEKIKFNEDLPFYEDAFFMTSFYLATKKYQAFNNILYYYRLYNSSSSKKFNRNYLSKYQLFFDLYKENFGFNEQFLASLYLDSFCSVLIDKFTKSIKKFHFVYSYKLLKTQFIYESANYISKNFESNKFFYVLSNKIIKRKFLTAYFMLFFYRLKTSFKTRIKKIFK